MLLRWVFSDNPADWLAWIQGLTALALMALTAVYVRVTGRIAAASLRQAELTAASVAAAQRQVDAGTLDRYVPIESAVSTALGAVRGSKIVDESIRYDFGVTAFEAAVRAADYVGGSVPPVMQVALALLRSCQSHRDALVEMSKTSAPHRLVVMAHHESLKIDLEGAQTILQAAYDALKPVIDRLRASTGRRDLTFENPRGGAA